MPLYRLFLVLLLVGCKQKPQDTDTDGATTTGDPGTTPTGGTTTGTPPTTDPACADPVIATWPTDGRTNVYYRTTIDFRLSPPPVGNEQLEVSTGGVPVAGQVIYFDDRVGFVPDAPLAASTTYDVQLADCPASQVSWTTSSTGDPVPVDDLIGTAFAVDIASGRWIEPAGAGLILGGGLYVDVLIGVQYADASSIEMLGAVSESGTLDQDMCTETIPFPLADFTGNPYFEIGPEDIQLEVMGALVSLFDVEISASFRPDLTGLEGATLTGFLDTRGLVPLLAPGGPDTAVCDLLVPFLVTCLACPDGSGDYCVHAQVEDLAVPAIAGPIVPRTPYDIAQDPTCP